MSAALARLFAQSRRACVFTGAGISTESGIPDFRSPGGIWSGMAPIDFRDFLASEEMRRESWRRKFASESVMAGAAPNAGHRAIARLVAAGRVEAVITQNVDGLHQRSGVGEGQLIELHGNATYARCLDCGLRHEFGPIREAFLAAGTLPLCTACGGIVKTATISFGQAMPEAEMARARVASLACDLMLVVGSSLVVYPAAGFPALARENGARLVILNREETPLDPIADLVLNTEAEPTLERLLADMRLN